MKKILTGLFLWTAVGLAQAPAVPAKNFGTHCTICHGGDANGTDRAPAILGFLGQFFLIFLAGFGLRFMIARYGKTRALGICIIVVLADCLLGALRINNANFNMAVWAIPLLASTLATRRSAHPTPSHRLN